MTLQVDTGLVRAAASDMISEIGNANLASVRGDNAINDATAELVAAGWDRGLSSSASTFTTCWTNDMSGMLTATRNVKDFVDSYCSSIDAVNQ